MKQFANRVIALLVAVALTGCGIILLLIQFDLVAPASIAIGDVLLSELTDLDQLSGGDSVLSLVVSATVAGLGVVLGVFELASSKARVLVLQDSQSGVTQIPESSVIQMLEREAASLPDVLKASARLKRNRTSINVRCDAIVEENAVVTAIADAVRSHLRDRASVLLGLSLDDVDVRARYPKKGLTTSRHKALQ